MVQSLTTRRYPLIVAVCGDSGTGKSTLTDGMVRVFNDRRITQVCLDDYHLLDRAARQRAGITALNPEANNFPLMIEHLSRLAHGESVVKPVYNHTTGTFGEPKKITPGDVIVVHGLHPLFTPELRRLANVRIYLDPETDLQQQWKITRDSTYRGYTVEQVQQEIAQRKRDNKLYIQPQSQFADILIRFSRGQLYFATQDPSHLDARLIEAKHAPKVDLSDILETSRDGQRPSLRLVEDVEIDGKPRDILEIDAAISHAKACELEDCIWQHMENASHLRPDRLGLLGRFYVGNVLRQSDTLALTQLIILYHVVSAHNRVLRGETLSRP